MRKIISLLLIYSVSFQLSAQQFKVALSETQAESETSENYALKDGGFIGMRKVQDEKGLVWVRKKESISILLYDAKMNVIKENKMGNGERAFGVVYTAFKKIAGKFWLLYSEPADKKGLGDFKAVEINPSTLQGGQPKTILSADESGLNAALQGMVFDFEIKFKSSPNENYSGLLISTGKKNGFLCALDKELNPLWIKKQIAADIDMTPSEINSWEVDDQGRIYLGYAKKNEGHIAVYKTASSPQILNITVGGGKPNDVVLLAHKNNSSLTIAGGYFENTQNVRGVFKGELDAALKIGPLNKIPFTEEVVKLFDSDSWGSTKPNKYGIEPEYIAQLYEVDDKTVDMVLEIKHKVYTQNVGMIVHSGSILNVYFNNGSAVFTRIPKYNVASGTDWFHYYAVPFQNKMIIFYNDNPVNLTKDINASPKLVDIEDNSVLVAAVVQPDGSVERRLPIERQEKYMGVAEWIKPVAENGVQVPVYTKKRLSYATISFQ
jgi:hypothetical protein